MGDIGNSCLLSVDGTNFLMATSIANIIIATNLSYGFAL